MGRMASAPDALAHLVASVSVPGAMNGREYPRLMCVLCGLIVMYDDGGSVNSWPSRCAANGNGPHIEPGTPGAEEAKQLHAAWLRDPLSATNAIAGPSAATPRGVS